MLSAERRAGFTIGETIRVLAEPRCATALGFYGPGETAGVNMAEGTPDLRLTAWLGLKSNDGWDLSRRNYWIQFGIGADL